MDHSCYCSYLWDSFHIQRGIHSAGAHIPTPTLSPARRYGSISYASAAKRSPIFGTAIPPLNPAISSVPRHSSVSRLCTLSRYTSKSQPAHQSPRPALTCFPPSSVTLLPAYSADSSSKGIYSTARHPSIHLPRIEPPPTNTLL